MFRLGEIDTLSNQKTISCLKTAYTQQLQRLFNQLF